MKEFLVISNNGEKFHLKGKTAEYANGAICIFDEEGVGVAILTNVSFITEVTALVEKPKGRPDLGVKYR